MTISGEQALARVRATLGRDPQDCHEATIALETSGVTGREAHELGRSAARLAHSGGHRPPGAGPDRHRLSWEGPASVGLLLMALLWASMVTTNGGTPASGVLVGLPLGLALVGYLDRRYLSGDEGPRLARSNPRPVIVVVVAPCAILLLAVPGGVVGVGVVLMLLSGTFAARLGRAVELMAIIAVAFLASRIGLSSDWMAAASLVAVLVLVAVDLAQLPRTETPPARLVAGLSRGAAGLGLGLLTVPVIHASAEATAPALIVVVPSAIGGALAASILHRMWIVLPDLLESLPTGHRPDRVVGGVYVRLVALGATVAVTTTVAMSALVVALSPPHDRHGVITVLVAMALITVLGYSASVLQAMGAESQVALGLLGCGGLAIGAALLGEPIAVVATALIVIVHVAWLPLLVHLFQDPERALAARL